MLSPSHQWHIDEQVRHISSSVIVSNHLSYLDPLLFISLLKKQKTIVKSKFFNIPIFGNMLAWFGYVPSDAYGKHSQIMIKNMETMSDYLSSGGNLFIFPEGTRSKDGNINILNPGAFKIAKRCRAPIQVVWIANTDHLFRPGKFLFNTGISNHIVVKRIDTLYPDQYDQVSISELTLMIHALLGRKENESLINVNAGCNSNCHS
ncbi:MAG: 1-acyl-sn-glycerol-3-phosphate acyltransferase [Desulfobacterales bacterium]|nr:1-acyl-sn-glycerol-3-phosphate acyltransferase [Desulfobacterales bacterium]